jgi:hypothetical protein
VTIDIPSNLYNDNSWMGLALCASFSTDRDRETLFDNLVSETPHSLNCRFRTSVAGVDDKVFGCGTSRIEIAMLVCVGKFIWISYVRGEPFKYMLRQCSSIEASFESDLPGVTVQTCGFRLLFQHDQVEFEQKLKHCKALIDQLADSISQSTNDSLTQICKRPIHEQAETDDQRLGKRQVILVRNAIYASNITINPQLPLFLSLSLMTNALHACTYFNFYIFILQDFDGCSEFNLCFPPTPREILHWFSHAHPSNEPSSVKIDVPTNLYDDKASWMGLFLCAYFSVRKDQSEMLDSSISPQLFLVIWKAIM